MRLMSPALGLALTALNGIAMGGPVAPPSTMAPSTMAPSVPVNGALVNAVWRERHIAFVYRGRTARYSCDGLRDKVRAILLDLGARRDLKVVALGCGAERVGLDAMQPGLDLVFASPALSDNPGKSAHAGDLAPVTAHFEEFTLTRDAFRNLGVGDCELVEEVARQVLPKLATRQVQQDVTCVPNQLSGNRFRVHGEVLKALP
jgi:hypothetical protein